jgi:TPR repeat protein
MENPALTQLIDEIGKNSTDAYERLKHCLESKTDLDDKPASPQWVTQVINMLTFRAQKGNSPTMVFLGNAYLNGLGVEADPSKALDYARHAASLGEAGGEVLLGFLYVQGIGGVVKNYDRAFFWFKSALDKGHSMAANNLGVIYEQGLGVKKDINLALKYYRQAASQKNPLALKNLERLSQTGGAVK